MAKVNQDDEKAETVKRPAVVSKYRGKANLRRVTVPIVRLNQGDSVAAEFTGGVRMQQIGKGKEPATLLRFTDMDTGVVGDMIAPTVLVSTLKREYGDELADLPGKKLLVEVSQREGKKYMDVFVSEIVA